MRKTILFVTGIFLCSSIFGNIAFADEEMAELQLAEGINCPCKAETIASPPPPPPSAPAQYYGGLELFGLTKSLLEGGTNVASDGSSDSGPFPTDQTLIDIDDATDDFDFGGGRLTIGRMLDERDAVEFTMMGFQHESRSSVVDTVDQDINAVWEDNPVIGFLGPLEDDDFRVAEEQILDSNTRLVSLEANYRRQLTRIFSALVGIRYAYLGDDLLLISDEQGDIGYLDLEGDNHLAGLQIGVDAQVPLTQKLFIDTGVKVGGYFNYSTIDLIIADADNDRFQFNDTDFRGSAISEGNLGFRWKFSENMSASLGYMAMLFSWVTTSGENFPQANTEEEFTKHNSDHILVHGPLARINIQFN